MENKLVLQEILFLQYTRYFKKLYVPKNSEFENNKSEIETLILVLQDLEKSEEIFCNFDISILDNLNKISRNWGFIILMNAEGNLGVFSLNINWEDEKEILKFPLTSIVFNNANLIILYSDADLYDEDFIVYHSSGYYFLNEKGLSYVNDIVDSEISELIVEPSVGIHFETEVQNNIFKWGLIDFNFNVIVPAEFDIIKKINEQYFAVYDENIDELYDENSILPNQKPIGWGIYDAFAEYLIFEPAMVKISYIITEDRIDCIKENNEIVFQIDLKNNI